MLRLLVLAACLAYVSAERKANVVLQGPDVHGVVTFTQTSDGILVSGTIQGLTPGLHGFHVHALGDLSNGCASTGGHFNPYNQTHGAPNATVRHVGDLGNVEANSTGIATINMVDNIISFVGETNIMGRGVVVHAGADDLGLGDNDESLVTGNAGARVACGVIGTLNENEGSAGFISTPVVSTLTLTLVILIQKVLS